MAFFTVGGALGPNKLALVVVGMAIGTAVMLHGVGIAGLMTCFAVDEPVLAFQQVARLAVVESRHLLDHMERDL